MDFEARPGRKHQTLRTAIDASRTVLLDGEEEQVEQEQQQQQQLEATAQSSALAPQARPPVAEEPRPEAQQEAPEAHGEAQEVEEEAKAAAQGNQSKSVQESPRKREKLTEKHRVAPGPQLASGVALEPRRLKLLLVGAQDAGKTCFLARLVNDEFDQSYRSTIGIDFKIYHTDVDGEPFKLQLWDTAGNERFKAVTVAYYPGAQGIVLLYDVTSQESFDAIPSYIKAVRKHGQAGVPFVLVGTKADGERAVSTEAGQALAAEHGVPFAEVSAKSGEGVREIVAEMVREAVKRLKETGKYSEEKVPEKVPIKPVVKEEEEEEEEAEEEEEFEDEEATPSLPKDLWIVEGIGRWYALAEPQFLPALAAHCADLASADAPAADLPRALGMLLRSVELLTAHDVARCTDPGLQDALLRLLRAVRPAAGAPPDAACLPALQTTMQVVAVVTCCVLHEVFDCGAYRTSPATYDPLRHVQEILDLDAGRALRWAEGLDGAQWAPLLSAAALDRDWGADLLWRLGLHAPDQASPPPLPHPQALPPPLPHPQALPLPLPHPQALPLPLPHP